MIRNTFSWKGLHRWRAALIVVFVIPAVLGASAVTPSVEKLQNPLVESEAWFGVVGPGVAAER
jgi:anti-sigma-K factor RskA